MRIPIYLSPVLALLLFSCDFRVAGQYVYQPPERLDDGLAVGTLAEVGLDTNRIGQAVARIRSSRYREVHAMLICRGGKLVLEEYFPGHAYQWDAPAHHGPWVAWDRDRLHDIHSDTKSVTSICIGIAIEQGFIDNVHQSIFDYLPEHQQYRSGGKEAIAIEHLLTMTSGLAWGEWTAPYSSLANDAIGIWFQQEKDPISYILDKPLVAEPGTHFNYAGGNQMVLGEIIRYASGLRIDTFAQRYLFEPLGIDTARWPVIFPDGVVEAAGSLQLTPRAMVKLGLLYLNDGLWQGKRIVSSDWVKHSATPYAGNRGINIPEEPSGKMGYSYSWWTKTYHQAGKEINMFAAGGWGGQHIMVLPEVNMVVVFTGGNYTTSRPPYKILRKFVLPAIE